MSSFVSLIEQLSEIIPRGVIPGETILGETLLGETLPRDEAPVEIDEVTTNEIESKIEQSDNPQNLEVNLKEFLLKIANNSGYFDSLRAAGTEEAENRLENIYELFSVAEDYTQRCIEEGESCSLAGFLERASLNSDLDNAEKQAEGSVSLMTLHLAKGLEFEIVFLVGLEEGLLPHSRSLDEKQALEEERRLCYVGMTRAKKELFLSYAQMRSRMGWGGGQVSRFLLEIPDELFANSNSFNSDVMMYGTRF